MDQGPRNEQWTRCRFGVELATTGVSLGMLVFDICTDLLLAWNYLHRGEELNFGLTISLIILPSVVVQFYSYAWFVSDKKNETTWWLQMCEEVPAFRCVTGNKWILSIVHVLQMGLFMRALCLIYLGVKAYRKHAADGTWDLLTRWCNHQADLTMLRLFETMLESTPQLLLQVHIVLLTRQPNSIQCITIVASSIAIAWTLLDYHMTLRNSLENKEKLKLLSLAFVVFLSSKYFLLLSQLLTLCLLTVLWPWYYVIPVWVLIWVLMTLTVYFHETEFMDTGFQEFVYRCTVGFILIFSFFNVKKDATRRNVICYYLFTCLEIVVAVGETTWRHISTLMTTEIWMLAIVISIVVGFVLGIGFMCLYYGCLHPTRGKYGKVSVSRSSKNSSVSCAVAYDEVDTGCWPGATDTPNGTDSASPQPPTNGHGGGELQPSETGAEGGQPQGTGTARSRSTSRLERCIRL
ncbi:XK-related protein 9-like [Lethenteron reissneri]|uniref:XK-related protein 9-like n=1 Tax=Lethenteron reissneri TaxID=7753 RepID=UPI002AB645A2|nr:XK-related protein 9-like [Lethenteron reissneri]XP_061418598.1 XK-related protein 9-like [Lethenteron reissneri]XP_061418599.1 XK-related protein 9-like [Lethenteron reissneri]XP_061418600.1 XK-related protein 9-like [Lethenteron reissneri]